MTPNLLENEILRKHTVHSRVDKLQDLREINIVVAGYLEANGPADV
jgi:hypothetical protein